MDITFARSRLEKIFNSEKALLREYGKENARLIMRRMAVLRGAATLDDVSPFPPERRHALVGDLRDHFAVDLKHPFRLVLKPNHDPIPRKPDGGTDLRQISAIVITVVQDYH